MKLFTFSNFKKRIFPIATFVVFGCLSVFVVVTYVKTERKFYYWDSLHYQEKLIQTCLQQKPINKHFESLLFSIQHDDYTDLGVYPLLPLCWYFGSNRLQYMLYVTFLYALPAVGIFYLVVLKYGSDINPTSALTKLVYIATAFLFPQLWAPVLIGFIDIGGLFIIGIVLLITFRNKPTSTTQDIIIVLCLATLIFWRRWYAFWVVGYIGGLFIESVFDLTFQNNYTGKKLILVVIKLVVVVGGILFLSYWIGGSELIGRFTANYANIYYPWKFESSIFELMSEFVSKVGIFTILLMAFSVFYQGVFFSLKSRSILLISSFFITYYLFHKIQSFGPQHLYLLLPVIIILISTTIGKIIQRLPTLIKYACISGYLFFLCLNFIWVFVPIFASSMGGISFLFPEYRYPPLIRHDVDALRALLKKTQDLYDQDNGRITLVASSEELNGSLLRYACKNFQLDEEFCGAISYFGGVDTDGFPDVLFNSRYLLVADPIQYHLRPIDQRSIGIFATEIKKTESIGKYFMKIMPGYQLDNGIIVNIYLQKASIPQDEVENLFGEIRSPGQSY